MEVSRGVERNLRNNHHGHTGGADSAATRSSEAPARAAAEPDPQQSAVPPTFELRMPTTSKLAKFNGTNRDVKDWIEDAQGMIRTLKDNEKRDFVIRHLEGDARKEVKLAPKSDTIHVQDIFQILQEAFGEIRSAAKIKKLLYERVQRPNESVREFSRSLLEFADKLKDSEETKNTMLREVLCENIRDLGVKRELKRTLIGQPNMSFPELRSLAIKLLDTEAVTGKCSEVQVDSFEGECCGASATVPDNQLKATLDLIVKQQSQLIDLLTHKFQPPSTSPFSPSRVADNRKQDVQCY